MQKLSTRDGYALLLVLMVMLVILVLAFTLGTLTRHQQQNVVKEEYFLNALNAAEAGIEAALARIKGEPLWYANFPMAGTVTDAVIVFAATEWADQASYEVQAQKYAEDIGTSLHLESVGRQSTGEGVSAGQKTLQSTVGVFEAGDYLRGLTVLPNAPASLDLEDTLVLDGDLLINGVARLAETTVVNGGVYTSGDITGTWSGIKRAGYLFIPPFPEPNEDVYRINAEAYGEVYVLDTSFGTYWDDGAPDGEGSGPVTAYDGIYFVDGDITIGGSYCGSALLFATGSITVAGDLVPEPATGMLALVALGNVDIQDYTVYANILAGGSLQALGGAALYGSACVTGLDFGCSIDYEPVYIYHQENLYPIEDFIPIKTKIVDWQEQYPVF
ncbi:MAG: hypothetical protein VR67_01620 [Peptococcaceae bacterium BRH_c8a]|nr:MAG: hypothetical protein VR67_01620 [Peptococcaceae bacterium BRH_c8a]